MENKIEFNFIYSYDAIKSQQFLGNIPKSIDRVNYVKINNKLTKNDYCSDEPSNSVIASYVMRELNKILKNDSCSCVYYVLSNINEDIIKNVQKIVNRYTLDKRTEYNMYIDPSYLSKNNINESLFNNIIEF